jgi:DNA-binding GntR family transcriptional regulator
MNEVAMNGQAHEGRGQVSEAARRELVRVINRGDTGADSGSIVDEVIVTIGADIIEGRLLPGADLNTVELARTFGTSRTPIREALLTLEREGFVDVHAHKRPRVAMLDIDEVRELYYVRANLYAMVSRCVVDQATDADLDRLEDLQEELVVAAADGDHDAYFWVNVRFRQLEAEIGRNRTLARVLDSLSLRMLQFRHVSLSMPGRLEQSVKDHDRLLLAYRERNGDLAAALTQSLVLGGLAAIERQGWDSVYVGVGRPTGVARPAAG